jgi:murein DD-endopeptidase MepM/ murein hydrolase activator NlpD
MEPFGIRRWVARASGLIALALPLLAGGCATLPAAEPASKAARAILPSDEDDFSQLIAQLTIDLNRYRAREIERTPRQSGPASTRARDREFAERARALFAQLQPSSLLMPVVGLTARDLEDSWHAPRDGGTRLHTGIDIFAPKGTPIVAVSDGIISYIGDQPKGGHCLWLTTEIGVSFYYAHLDRWAPGIYEGMEVQSGDLLGFVGNTGNAIHTPSHLHFAINRDDAPVNPYPLLVQSTPTRHAHVRAALSGGFTK